MTDKLEALSQPIAWTDAEELAQMNAGTYADMFNGKHIQTGDGQWIALYSQEYVTALLAALEEKDQRIAELAVTQMTGPLSLVLKRAAELERIIEGVDQLAIDGGWTARKMSEYAKSLETRNAELEQRLQQPIKLPLAEGEEKQEYLDKMIEVLNDAGLQIRYTCPHCNVLLDLTCRPDGDHYCHHKVEGK